MERLGEILTQMLRAPVDPALRFALFYIVATVLIAFGIWLYRGRPKSFISWLIPKSVYTHRSNIVDIWLFLINRLLGVSGIFGALVFTPLVAFNVLVLIAATIGGGYEAPVTTATGVAITTGLVVIVNDFSKYWTHRIHHEWSSLWPFHAVHHSADVLTPVTVARVHPVEIFIRNIMSSVVVGILQGILLYTLVGRIDFVTIGGANVIYVVFNTLGSNFRHSHIWVSYGRVLEHILISPAQHQIHHSSAQKHFNKNYGSIFAIWDWMFGTLYVPESYEDLHFGVADGDGNPIEQPYPTMRAAMLNPFVESFANIKARFRPDEAHEDASPHQHPAE